MDARLGAFRIYCGLLAAEFSSFYSKAEATEIAAKTSPFFRRSANTCVSYNTMSEAYAFVWFLEEEFGDEGVVFTTGLKEILDTLKVFYDNISAFRDNLDSADYHIPLDYMSDEVTSWLATEKNKPIDTFWRNIKAGGDGAGVITDADIGGNRLTLNEKTMSLYHSCMQEFQTFIVRINSYVHCRFRGSPDFHRVVPRIHFLLCFEGVHDLHTVYGHEEIRYNPDGWCVDVEMREHHMFLRSVFLENDYVAIPFSDDIPGITLVVVSFTDKVRKSFLLHSCFLRLM